MTLDSRPSVSSMKVGVQQEASPNYPYVDDTPAVTAAKALSVQAFLLDPACLIPEAKFTALAEACQSISTTCGKLNAIVKATTTSVVLINAIRNNLPGFGLMVVGGIVTSAAEDAGVDPNAIVASAVRRANEILTTPQRFIEECFRARSHAQASFTVSTMADVFGALRSVGDLLVSCKTLSDLLSGGVSAKFGPNADNTNANRRAVAAGISISGDQIRAGLAAVAQAMRNLGSLWDPNDPELVGTPRGFVISLHQQGIAELIGLRQALYDEGVFLDDEEQIRITSDFVILNALGKITDNNSLNTIVRRTGCLLAQQGKIRSAADFCRGDVVLAQNALDQVPYADMAEFGRSLAFFGIKGTVTWNQIADVLDQLELPSLGLIDQPNFASDMANLKNFIGSGSGLFNEPNLTDLIGTAAGATHREAYEALLAANAQLEGTAEGQALIAAIDYYQQHDVPSDPLNAVAEAQLIAAIELTKQSLNPVVQEAIATADKSILDSALQLVGEITAAVATGYSIYATYTTLAAAAATFATKISAAASSLGSTPVTQADVYAATSAAAFFPEGLVKFSQSLWAAIKNVEMIADMVLDSTGISGIIEACCNLATPGGQAIKAMIVESRNQAILNKLGMKLPQIDLAKVQAKALAATGYPLTTEQRAVISSYATQQGWTTTQTQQFIEINALYGYQRHYFEKLEGLVESGRGNPLSA